MSPHILYHEERDTDAAKGIINGCLISLAFWAAVLFAAYWIHAHWVAIWRVIHG